MTQDAINSIGQPPAISHFQIEHLQETLGIDIERPRLSWRVETSIKNWQQAGFEITCFDRNGNIRDQTGRIESSQSVLVDWPFAPLQSRQRVSLQVLVWGKDGSVSEWSEPVWLESGLLHADDWRAKFISPSWYEDISKPNPAPYLRHEFELRNEIKSARLYITALGVYEAQLNGQVIGDHILAPGWTVYDQRLRYQTFDVTEFLKPGRNAIGTIVADGWYRGRLGYGGGRRNIYGENLALLAQLEIQYADGSSERIITDETWRAAIGPILMSDIYDGETYDARLELTGWSEPGFDDAAWTPVNKLEEDLAVLEAPLGPPVRRTEMIKPVSITQSPSGKMLVDFGQNLVGRLTIRVQGPSGQTVTMRHAEVLENGELWVRPLRLAEATDRYTLHGGEVETWEPKFTFHGFRYAELTNWPGDLQPDDIQAVVLHSDMERTGWFECSNPLLNRLHENIIWSMRGNFLDIPTDCPQRDERLGWTGDIQVFASTAAFLYDTSSFLQSWLADLAIEQQKSGGSVPQVVPDILGDNGAAAWGDAAVIVPWTIYLCYGDTRLLEEQYESMVGWVNYINRRTGDDYIWRNDFQYGDWLDYRGEDERWPTPVTNTELIATAFFAYSTHLLANAARVLGKSSDEESYADLAQEVKAAFNNEFVTPNGRVGPNTQTAYVLALHFDLLPESMRPIAAKRLAEAIIEADYHLTTGFVGTPYLCHVLSRFGYLDVAYKLLNQESYPSWLYPVKQGATTIWERWDGIRPDGSLQDPEMNSFNHYAYGAIGDWLYQIVAGLELDPDAPGYKRFHIQPQPGGGLTFAKVTHDSMYGRIESKWTWDKDVFHIAVTIPANSEGIVHLPTKDVEAITEYGHALSQVEGIREFCQESEEVIISLGSGSYSFHVKIN